MRLFRRDLGDYRLYSRAGCHLCQEVATELERRARRGELSWTMVDIAQDPVLEHRFGQSIPVLEQGGRVLAKGRFTLDEALQRRRRRQERAS